MNSTISFQRIVAEGEVSAKTQWTNLVENTSLIPGRIYIIHVREIEPFITSLFIATSSSQFDIILENAIATPPTQSADGKSLEYYDSYGNLHIIYNKLNFWEDYVEGTTNDWVLSAGLGHDLYIRATTPASEGVGGILTADYQVISGIKVFPDDIYGNNIGDAEDHRWNNIYAYNGNFSVGLYVGGSATAVSFVKTDGTSSEFLKADGSVDQSTYLTSVPDATTTVKGIVVLGATGGAATYIHTHSAYVAWGSANSLTIPGVITTSEGQVSFGANDSAGVGSGYRLMRVPNI